MTQQGFDARLMTDEEFEEYFEIPRPLARQIMMNTRHAILKPHATPPARMVDLDILTETDHLALDCFIEQLKPIEGTKNYKSSLKTKSVKGEICSRG